MEKKRDIGLADIMLKKARNKRGLSIPMNTCSPYILCSVFKLHSVGIAGVHRNTLPSLVLYSFLPARASEQGNVIGLVSVYICTYVRTYVVVIKKKL